MNFFKKQKPKEPKPDIIKEETYDVGRTKVEVLLKDRRQINTWVYGTVYQNKDYNIRVTKSTIEAQQYISQIGSSERTIADDWRAPTHSKVGEPIEFTILETEPFSITVKNRYKDESP